MEALERPAVRLLSAMRYQVGTGTRTHVNIDYHVEVNNLGVVGHAMPCSGRE